MIKFNDEFSFERDKYQWILHQQLPCKDKDGNPKMKPYTTYHASIKQICSQIIERSLGKCESLDEIQNLIDNAVESLTKYTEALT